MPGTHQVTVTAKTGPAAQNTAMVITNVRRLEFDMDIPRLQIQVVTGAGDNIKEYDMTGVTIVTCTVTSGNTAWVVS